MIIDRSRPARRFTEDEQSRTIKVAMHVPMPIFLPNITDMHKDVAFFLHEQTTFYNNLTNTTLHELYISCCLEEWATT